MPAMHKTEKIVISPKLIKQSGSTDDGGETDTETAASTPARSSVSSPNPEPATVLSSSLIKKEDVSLPSEINTSKTESGEKKNADEKVALTEEDYSNWPMENVKEPHFNDVLYGRGGGTNHHPGNKRYRKLVEGRKVDYVNSKRLDKPLVALQIIKEWRAQKPPGRFLKLDEQTSLWHDVGDKKAREKTSQALREKAPLLRKQQEEQRKERENANIGKAEKVKNTRFDLPLQPSPKANKNLKRVMLTRDHSLGRDYITAGETVSVKGFSWNSPILKSPIEEVQQQSWDAPIEPAHSRSGESAMAPQPPPPTPAKSTQATPDPYRQSDAYGVSPYSTSSPSRYDNRDWSSSSTPHHHHHHSHHHHHPHTPNDSMMNDWRAGYRTEEGPRKDYGATSYDYRRTRSAPDDRYYNSDRGYYSHPQATHPQATLPQQTNDSHLQPLDYQRVANIVGAPSQPQAQHQAPPSSTSSNYMQNWKSMNSPRHHSDGMYDTSPYQSPDRMNPMTPSSYGHHWNSPRASSSHTSPPRPVDYYNNSPYHAEVQRSSSTYPHRYDTKNNNTSQTIDGIPRPPTVKRDTSHKLQTNDVEPTTKRLNRQSSSGRRNTSISSIEEITDKDMNHLNVSLKRGASLGTTDKKDDIDLPRKPPSLKESDRVSTIDKFFVGMDDGASNSPPSYSKPRPLEHGDRMSTMDQINILVKDIDGDSYPLDGLGGTFPGTEDIHGSSVDNEIFGVLSNTESV